MTKAALSMAVKLFAARLAPHHIPVFEIQPGIIRTDMIAAVESVYEERIAGGNAHARAQRGPGFE